MRHFCKNRFISFTFASAIAILFDCIAQPATAQPNLDESKTVSQCLRVTRLIWELTPSTQNVKVTNPDGSWRAEVLPDETRKTGTATIQGAINPCFDKENSGYSFLTIGRHNGKPELRFYDHTLDQTVTIPFKNLPSIVSLTSFTGQKFPVRTSSAAAAFEDFRKSVDKGNGSLPLVLEVDLGDREQPTGEQPTCGANEQHTLSTEVQSPTQRDVNQAFVDILSSQVKAGCTK